MYYLQDRSSCSQLERRGLLGNHQPETLKDEITTSESRQIIEEKTASIIHS